VICAETNRKQKSIGDGGARSLFTVRRVDFDTGDEIHAASTYSENRLSSNSKSRCTEN